MNWSFPPTFHTVYFRDNLKAAAAATAAGPAADESLIRALAHPAVAPGLDVLEQRRRVNWIQIFP